MKNRAELKKGQSGQILIYTTLIVMLAALILVPLMEFAFTSHKSAQVRKERTLELYASDSGIEDALYQIKTEMQGTELADLGFGDTSSYDIGTPGMNDRTENVSVQKVWIPEGDVIPPGNRTAAPTIDTDKSSDLMVVGMLKTIQAAAASDDFDSGWPNGGSTTGWADPWDAEGATIVSSTLGCGGTSYALRFANIDGSAVRTANLLKYMQPQVKFNAKASSLGAGDTVDLNVTYGSSAPETVWSWPDGNESCTSYSFDLNDLYGWGGNDTSVPLQIEFDADLSIQNVAQDDFSSGNWAGGSGWYSGSWTASGSGASVVSTGSPHSDSYHVKLSSTGYVMRRVSLASVTNPQITVWAKPNGFGSSDKAYLKVSTKTSPNPTVSGDWSSPNGATKQTWTISDSASYTSYTYDLSAYAGQNVWILFSGSISTTGATVASDGFESGGWSGNPTQWTASWAHSSSNSWVTTSGSPRTGSYHLRLNRAGYAEREKDLSSYTQRQLRFYYKMSNNWESSDHGYLKIYLNGSLYGTIDLTRKTSYSNSPSPYSYDLPQGQIKIRFETATSSDDEYLYVDDISILGDSPCFYFDDVSISEGASFYVDDLWIGDEYRSNTIEIAYTDATLGNAFLDRIGVWMPPGCHYVGVVGDQTSLDLIKEPTPLLNTYAGGTILEWDYGTVKLHQAVDGGVQVPIVRTLTFTFQVDVAQTVEGMFIWIAADAVNNGPPGPADTLDDYISWDKGYEMYKAVSQAHSEIYGSNTQVTAYASQGEVDKKGAAAYGDYVATGAPLLYDYNTADGLNKREKTIDSSNPYNWLKKDSIVYDGRSEIASIPADAEVTAAWLYWSAFKRSSAVADTEVDFMYPQEYGTETFAVSAGYGDDTHNTVAWDSDGESMDLLAYDPVLTLSNIRHVGVDIGLAVPSAGNETFPVGEPIRQSPAPVVQIDTTPLVEGTEYVIDYQAGNVTLISPALSGRVYIDYSVDGSMTLTEGTDYEIPADILGADIDIRYPCFTVVNDDLEGTVTIDCYYAKHWVTGLQHDAHDRYGTELPAVTCENDDGGGTPLGYSYVCFTDVTYLVKGTGNGQFAVNGVDATAAVDGTSGWPEWCYSAWSIIIVYESPSEEAHQLYLYDPIHNSSGNNTCPFYSGMNQDVPDRTGNFILADFYPPEGWAEGSLTYFVGEGDSCWPNESIYFKGASDASYGSALTGINNPSSDVMNDLSSDGTRGVDIDSFIVSQAIGTDTSANVKFHTASDSWNLCYIVLSFKTNEVPKSDYAFNVASVTYQYELGAQ